MKMLVWPETLQAAVRTLGQPCLWISFGEQEYAEVVKAAPYLTRDTYALAFGGGALIACEDEDEQRRVYDLTVGDDGPTDANPYDGPATVYALTISATGEMGTENT